MKLYALDHCPFCARVRVMFGLKNIPFDIEFVQQDDYETPIKISGNNLMPIIEYGDDQYMVESLDIVNYLDHNYGDKILLKEQDDKITDWINRYDALFDKITVPLYHKMNLPELSTDAARAEYRKIHESRTEDFNVLQQKAPELLKQTQPALAELALMIDLERVKDQQYSLDDIILYPMLRHITSIKEIDLPENIQQYITMLEQASKLPSYQTKAVSIYTS